MPGKSRPVLYLFAALFFVSGAAGLIYEIVWERLLELYFGVTMISVTLIVSAYLAGLGLGSLVGGRIARGLDNTLFLYGLIEIGIALFGAVSPRLILWLGEAMAGSPYILVFLISFAILLIPTFLMGMTLPFLTQSFVDQVDHAGEIIGILYGINTLGAAFGTVLAGYVLIGFYGFDGTVYIAVVLNALVGLCAFILARRQSAFTVESVNSPAASMGDSSWGYGAILLSSFWVGFIGLGFEMFWIRVLLIINKNTAYAFPSILFIFLLGLALGGYYWGRKADASKNPVALFCAIELAGAVLAALTFYLFSLSLQYGPPWIQNFNETQQPLSALTLWNDQVLFSRRALLMNVFSYFIPIVILVLPASLMLGGGLPVLDRIAIQNPLLSGRRVGDIHLANIVGSVVGSLVVSFVLLPAIGSESTLKALILSTFLFPALYVFHKAKTRSGSQDDRRLLVIGAAALLAVLLLPRSGEFYRRLYAFGTQQNVVVSEFRDSVLAVTFRESETPQTGSFWIGGEVNSVFFPDGIYEQRAMACAGAARPKRILVIGFGGGYSTLFYQNLAHVEEIVVVELLGDVGPFLGQNMESARLTLDAPHVKYLADDGRRYLNANPDEKFDLISIDPLRRHTAGHNNLYSEEALRIYQEHLTENGILCVWMDEPRIIPKTMAHVFPYVDQFRNEFMVVSNAPITYSIGHMQAAAESYASLTGTLYGSRDQIVLDPASLPSRFVRDQDQVLEEEAQTLILRDMDPWLEYYLLRMPVDETVRSDIEAIEMFKTRIVE